MSRLLESPSQRLLLITELSLETPLSYSDAWEHARLNELIVDDNLVIVAAAEVDRTTVTDALTKLLATVPKCDG